jgi:hypothetical protein
MDLQDFFGVNVLKRFETYLDSEEFKKWLEDEFPPTDPEHVSPISAVILDNDFRRFWDWRTPLKHVLWQYVLSGDTAAALAPDGTIQNVGGKLRFVLRENKNSVEAQTHLYLVQPGDFPFQGAGTHRGFTGGVSGRKQEEDWAIFCHLVDHLISLLDQVVTQASETCQALRRLPGCPPGLKYMNVIALREDVDPSADVQEFFAGEGDLLMKARNAMSRARINTIAELIWTPNEEILRVEHVGPRTMSFINERIKYITFQFAA